MSAYVSKVDVIAMKRLYMFSWPFIIYALLFLALTISSAPRSSPTHEQAGVPLAEVGGAKASPASGRILASGAGEWADLFRPLAGGACGVS